MQYRIKKTGKIITLPSGAYPLKLGECEAID